MRILVRTLTDLLPKGYTAHEDEDCLFIRCGWCGQEIVFYCYRGDLLSVQAAVTRHHKGCPGRPPGA